MADKTISQLSGSAVPMTGAELVPIVRSGVTVRVSVTDLTAGRSVAALGAVLTSTDAAAAAGPTLDLYRDSASPAVSDVIGEIQFNGEDSAGNKQQYGAVYASILSPTTTAETGKVHIATTTAGTSTDKVVVDSAGNVNVTTGNVVPAVSGKGIDFSATASPGSDKVLNDAAYGTWVPSAGTQTVIGAFTSDGTYIKIGRLVFARGEVIGATSIAGASGTTIGNLPFTVAASGQGTGVIANQTASSTIYANPGTASIIVIDGYAATGYFEFSLVYEAAAL